MRYLKWTPENVDRAAADIREGKLVVWPSPVWYGLATNGLDSVAVKRIYKAKRRAPTEALLILALGIQDAEYYGEVNGVARKLIDELWPGYVGIIVRKRRENVPDHITAGKDTVLLAQLDELGHDLPAKAGVPVVSTSANLSGTPPCLDMDDVRAFVEGAGEEIDTIIEGPLSPLNRPTTIVDTTVSPPTILRLGVVHERAIQKIVPDVVVQSPA
jgi:L-threonylcarbamoyladenylate synthase